MNSASKVLRTHLVATGTPSTYRTGAHLQHFEYDLPATLTTQIRFRLEAMPAKILTEKSLETLAQFQARQRSGHGIYQLLLKNKVVYIWKSVDAEKNLRRHLMKLRGRRKIPMRHLRFRCLLMHRNWCTVANEDLLIAHYKAKGQCKWNSSGFGAKDVGRERDGTEPNWFDRTYPINADYPCKGIPDSMTIKELLATLKTQLPFTFRYELDKQSGAREIELARVRRTPRALITQVVRTLGPEWQATIFRSHIVLYREQRGYKHGEIIACR